MKAIKFLLIALIIIVATTVSRATGIGISFSSKAYWSEKERSCLDREKGCCFHIGVTVSAPGQIPGNISDESGLTLIIPKKTIPQEVYQEFFRNGQFYLEGEGTFEADILKQLNLPLGFTLKPGTYQTQDSGDSFKIILK